LFLSATLLRGGVAIEAARSIADAIARDGRSIRDEAEAYESAHRGIMMIAPVARRSAAVAQG
jgi:hypothetical protein